MERWANPEAPDCVMAPADALKVLRHRRPLERSRSALQRGELTVGFLGGSITAPKTGTRWPEPWANWLAQQFPGVRLLIENAALGATGTDLAVFRAQQTIIARGCEVVFIEFAVNDIDQTTERRMRTREGLLRQLIDRGIDVVLVYTYCVQMLPDMEAGVVPPTIAEFDLLADHYGIGSVWAGLHAWREVRSGRMSWDDWLPDGLHPEWRGSVAYSQPVEAFCEREWYRDPAVVVATSPTPLPSRLSDACWDRVECLPLERAEWCGLWALHRWSHCLGMPRALHSTAPGGRVRIEFEGRGIVLGFDFGRLSSEVRVRVDEGPWQETRRDRPAWAGDRGWFRPLVVADDLVAGWHVLELQTVVPEGDSVGAAMTTIGLIGVIK